MKLNKEQKEKIWKWIEDLNEIIIENLNYSIKVEEFGSSITGTAEGIIEENLEQLGDIINIDLSDLDTTLSLEEIEHKINTFNFNGINSAWDIFDNIEEIEEIESTKEVDGKYIYTEIIWRYKPANVYFKTRTQSSSDVDLDMSYEGIVTKKEVITYEWI